MLKHKTRGFSCEFPLNCIIVFNLLTTSSSNAKLLLELDRGIIFRHSLLDSLQNYDPDFTSYVVFSEEVEQSLIYIHVLKKFGLPVTILNTYSLLPKYSKHILFSKNVSFYSKLFKKNNYSDQLEYFILWTWPAENKTLEAIFAAAWNYKLIKVLGFVEQKNSDVNIYTYFPYGPNRCGEVGPPLLLDTWNSTEKNFIKKREKNKNLKTEYSYTVHNFYGCPIKLLVKNRPPDAALLKKNNSIYLKGSGGKILSSIKKIYNLTVSVQLVHDGFHQDKFGYIVSNKSVLKVNKMLMTQDFDFAFGVFSYMLNYLPQTDFSHYFMIEKFAFHVPCGTVKVWTVWKDYYKEFSLTTWASVICLFMFFAVCFKIITALLPQENTAFSSFWSNMFTLMALHVESPVCFRVKTNTMRFYLTVVMFYCTIISVAYRSALKSFLMAPLEANSIQSWEQLEMSNLKITGTLAMFTILNKTKKDQPVLNNIAKKFIIKASGEFSDIVDDVTVSQDTACLAPEGMIAYYNSMRNEDNRISKLPICQVTPYLEEAPASTFLVRKGSMFLIMVNRVIVDHMQAGYMNHFGASRTIKTSSSHAYNKNNQVKFSMKDAKGALLLLLLGLIIAFVIFIFEIVYCRFFTNKIIVK